MGNRLRKLFLNVKGLGDKGKLTDITIDRLQNYYGIAIRSNQEDLVNMKNLIFSALFHCASSEKTIVTIIALKARIAGANSNKMQ